MMTTPEYEALAIILSALCLILAVWHAWRCTTAYRRWADNRSAVSLGKAVGLTVVSFGLLVSAAGFIGDGNATLAVAGLSIARGALFVLLATLILANLSGYHAERDERDEAP